MKDFIWYLSVALGVAFGLLVTEYALADNKTVIQYQGQPVPSAMAPSMSAFSQDVCAVPVSGGANTGVFAISGGTVMTDDNCVRLKNAKALHDMGLKVAAVSLLCKNPDVWDAMEMSGSPCPVGGSVGDAARAAWWELDPARFKKLYGQDYQVKHTQATNNDEEVTTYPYNPDDVE
jgi:hypothetical protein